MKHLSHLWLLLVLALSLSSCHPDTNTDIVEDGTLTLELSMPQAVSIDGAKGSLGYYWNPEQTLFLQVSQVGKAPQQLALKPKQIQTDGAVAHFEVVLKSKDFDLDKPLSLLGAVAQDESAMLATQGGIVIQPEGLGGLLPYDLLKNLPHPLLLADQEVRLNGGKAKLSLSLSPLGKLMLLEWHNAGTQAITPQSLTFKAPKPLFPSATSQYDAYKKSFTGALSETSALLQAETVATLTPDFAIQYLYWLPLQELPTDLELSLKYLKGESQEAQQLTSKVDHLKGILSYRYLDIQKDGSVTVSETQLNVEADTSEGGDPHFSMNDILFWVGEGSKRAALVIEWHDDKTPDALVWGYRFDGDKTGYDMLNAIVAADPHLSILMGEQWGGYTLGAIGYQFKVTEPRAHFLLDGQPLKNNGKGVTIGEPMYYDKYTFSDPEAHYLCGFYTNGYWVYYTKDNRLNSWAYSNVGFTLRTLEDGSWDGLSFQHGMDSFVGNPHGSKFVAAPLPEK